MIPESAIVLLVTPMPEQGSTAFTALLSIRSIAQVSQVVIGQDVTAPDKIKRQLVKNIEDIFYFEAKELVNEAIALLDHGDSDMARCQLLEALERLRFVPEQIPA